MTAAAATTTPPAAAAAATPLTITATLTTIAILEMFGFSRFSLLMCVEYFCGYVKYFKTFQPFIRLKEPLHMGGL